jgi:hypothetical protein
MVLGGLPVASVATVAFGLVAHALLLPSMHALGVEAEGLAGFVLSPVWLVVLASIPALSFAWCLTTQRSFAWRAGVALVVFNLWLAAYIFSALVVFFLVVSEMPRPV